FVDKTRVIRTGLHAVGTPHAAVAVHGDDAVGALEGGLYRADRYAGRLITVIAQARQHEAGHLAAVGIGPLVLEADSAELPDRCLVLQRAADRAGLTANATAQIDDHAVAATFMAGAPGWLLIDCGFRLRQRHQHCTCRESGGLP